MRLRRRHRHVLHGHRCGLPGTKGWWAWQRVTILHAAQDVLVRGRVGVLTRAMLGLVHSAVTESTALTGPWAWP